MLTETTLKLMELFASVRTMRRGGCRHRRNSEGVSLSEWQSCFFHIARDNWHSWVCLAVLIVGFCVVEFVATPFVRRIPPDQWEDLKYPYDPQNTVPSFTVPLYGLVLPVVVAVLYHTLSGCEIREFHDLLYGVLINITITASATAFLKTSIGRLRPNFFERCYGDTFSVTGTLPFDEFAPPDCTNPDKGEVEGGRKSFPSGHSSWAMSSMFFITLFLIGKLRVFDGRGQFWKLIVSILPTCCAIAIGVTRINDYAHHWTDVVAGLLLGGFVALVVYLMYYPWPFARSGTETPLYKTLPALEQNPFAQERIDNEDETSDAMEEGIRALRMKPDATSSDRPS